jgi:subtilisin-like proprotein convertase family protein
MDGGPVRGTWTLTVTDNLNTGISNLVSWHLKVVAGRPFETK